MLKEKLLEDLKESMKEKNLIRKNTVQMIRAAILQVEKDKAIELNDDQIIDIIAKEAKKRKDAKADFEKSGREDLINQNKEVFATLDIAIIDLYKGNIEFIKSGACPTYIKKGDKVQILKANSLPAGIVPNAGLQVYDRDVDSGEILLMCSDGVLDSNVEYKNKELWLRYVLEDIETTNTKKIADLVLNEAIDNCYGVAKDDMSVLVCRFLRK